MKKRHLKRLVVVSASILIIIIIIFCLFIRGNNKRSEHIIIDNKDYSMKLDYPIMHIRKVDKKINNYIGNRKKDFINNIDKDSDIKYDFIIRSEDSTINNNIDVHLINEYYIGGNHYEREDYSIHYDKDKKKFLSLSDYFKDKDSFNKLDDIVFHYIMKNNPSLSEVTVRRGITLNNDNYNNFLFKEDGLEIIFPPYKVAPWSYGEVRVLLPYSNINKYLKKEYRGKYIKNNEEEVTPLIRDLSKYENKKLIAFTFDDGPNKSTTNYLLDNLDKYDAKVTFFVLGSRVDSNKETIKRAYKEGNQIASHTYDHKNLLYLSKDSVLKEINDTNKIIKDVIGVNPTLLRPPYGSINKSIQSMVGMPSMLWSIDTLDWKYRDSKKIFDTIVNSVKDGDIVLLHDLYKTSVDAALAAMDKLSKEGYAFVTIEEMMVIKDVELNNNKIYSGIY